MFDYYLQIIGAKQDLQSTERCVIKQKLVIAQKRVLVQVRILPHIITQCQSKSI